jgi:hypothetical protein
MNLVKTSIAIPSNTVREMYLKEAEKQYNLIHKASSKEGVRFLTIVIPPGIYKVRCRHLDKLTEYEIKVY